MGSCYAGKTRGRSALTDFGEINFFGGTLVRW